MVLLRKSIPQSRNLKAAAELNVRVIMKSEYETTISNFEAIGENQVRINLSSKAYNPSNSQIARDWLLSLERSRANELESDREQRESETLELVKESNLIANAANLISNESRIASIEANRIASESSASALEANRIANEANAAALRSESYSERQAIAAERASRYAMYAAVVATIAAIISIKEQIISIIFGT